MAHGKSLELSKPKSTFIFLMAVTLALASIAGCSAFGPIGSAIPQDTATRQLAELDELDSRLFLAEIAVESAGLNEVDYGNYQLADAAAHRLIDDSRTALRSGQTLDLATRRNDIRQVISAIVKITRNKSVPLPTP